MKKHTEAENSTVLFVREVPERLTRRVKALAALEGKSMRVYLLELLEAHVSDMEKRGLLPKGK